ncbi:hypothetical protein C8R46DRAFT_1344178 [Mycena filopes]|nr:hypothetical protein C8R46DRAFT_1344178 [Mycena filopes]
MAALNKLPTSLSYPDLVVIERPFQGTPKLRGGVVQVVAPIDNTKRAAKPVAYGKQAVAYEFRGFGVPPDDVGRIGDIFWDLVRPYIFYIRGSDGWRPWNPKASEGKRPLAQHPEYIDRYMWLSRHGLAWLTEKTLRAKAIVMDPKHVYGLDHNILDELDKSLDTGPSIVVDRARYDAEVARRYAHGVVKRSTRKRGTSSHLATRELTSFTGSGPSIGDFPPSVSQTFEKLGTEWKVALQKEKEGRLKAEAKAKYLETQLETLLNTNRGLRGLLKDEIKRCQELTERVEADAKNVETFKILKDDMKQTVESPAFQEILRQVVE